MPTNSDVSGYFFIDMSWDRTNFTFEEREVLKILSKGGCVVFEQEIFHGNIGRVCKATPGSGLIYHGVIMSIKRKLVKKLYKRSLLRKRVVSRLDYDEWDYYDVYEIYSPALCEYEQLKDIAVECALGV